MIRRQKSQNHMTNVKCFISNTARLTSRDRPMTLDKGLPLKKPYDSLVR